MTKNEMFVARLKELRTERNLSVAMLAKHTKIPRTTMSNWTLGRSPKIEALHILADFFDCSIDYLLGRKDY